MLRPLVIYPNPILRKKAEPIMMEQISTELVNDLALDLVDTCNVHYGLGLAANQIGSSLSMLVVRPRGVGASNPDPYENNDDFWVMINPKISVIVSLDNIENPEMSSWKEGCLSFPDFEVNVDRYKDINVQWTDLRGVKHSKDIGWPLSGIIQHEIEHLEGHNMTYTKKKTVRALLLSDYTKKRNKKIVKEKKERKLMEAENKGARR